MEDDAHWIHLSNEVTTGIHTFAAWCSRLAIPD